MKNNYNINNTERKRETKYINNKIIITFKYRNYVRNKLNFKYMFYLKYFIIKKNRYNGQM